MPHAGLDPSPWVERWAHLVPAAGGVLDLACGLGRHARYFAARGHAVLALDRDRERLAELAAVPGIETFYANLEDGSPWPLGDRRFAAVVVTNYLFRPLFPALAGSLAQGGVLVYETFAAGNERYGRPSNPEFLLRPGELLDAFKDRLQIVAFEQGTIERPKPAMIQRLCAVRGERTDASLPS